MTIITDHINIDRSEDPGYWYIWALSFSNTFKALFLHWEKAFNKTTYNIDKESPPPSEIVIWTIYAHTLELYMKTYLIVNGVPVKDLISDYSHDLEKIRSKCALTESRFDHKSLTWITQDLKEFTRLKWEDIKYPPLRSPLKSLQGPRITQRAPLILSKDIMHAPLDLLEGIVKPLIHISD